MKKLNVGEVKAICIQDAEQPNIESILYLSSFISDEFAINDIANKIVDTAFSAAAPKIDLEKEVKLDNVIFRLYNKSVLKDLPEEEKIYIFPFLDYVFVLYLLINLNDEKAVIRVTKEISCKLKLSELSSEDIFQVVKDNTLRLLPPITVNLQDIFKELGVSPTAESSTECVPMYVATNVDKCWGASSALLSKSYRALAMQLNTDIVIIPSSVHEFIYVECLDYSNFEINKIIEDVNSKCLATEEYLGSNALIYRLKEDKIELL